MIIVFFFILLLRILYLSTLSQRHLASAENFFKYFLQREKYFFLLFFVFQKFHTFPRCQGDRPILGVVDKKKEVGVGYIYMCVLGNRRVRLRACVL
jgi:hypothetical protein